MSTESYLLQIALTILDLLGVAVFSASGALKAAEKHMDIFEFTLVAAITAIGGGTLRDLLLGIRPVPRRLPSLCLATACLTFVLTGS